MIPQLPINETARLDWLRQAYILDTPREAVFDDITRLAAQICGVPIAAISLVDENRQWFKSIRGLDAQGRLVISPFARTLSLSLALRLFRMLSKMNDSPTTRWLRVIRISDSTRARR